MSILNTLYELSSQLSVADDSLGDDPNTLIVLKELIKQLDKVYLMPEIAITSMLCINYLVDNNPRYHSTICKTGGLAKIVQLTQNIEYIDLAENAIKCIEKLSLECPYNILEADGFNAILSLIDFFDNNLRKSALKSCLNMVRCVNSLDCLNKNVLPSMPALTQLCKLSDTNETSKQIQELAINVVYYIFAVLKSLNSYHQCKDTLKSVLAYGVLESLSLILNSHAGNSDLDKNNQVIYSSDTIKNVIKTFEIIGCLSKDGLDILLNLGMLKTINNILLNDVSKQNTNQGLYIELFQLMISLFPAESSYDKKTKLLAPYNSTFYFYFSDNLLSYLINNIINIPAVNSVLYLIKLVTLYVTFSDGTDIILFIDSNKIANICNKMLDSKDYSYIVEVVNLLKILLEKQQDKFLLAFIREGVYDNLTSIKNASVSEIILPTNNEDIKYNKSGIIDKIISEKKSIKDSYIPSFKKAFNDVNVDEEEPDYMNDEYDDVDMENEKLNTLSDMNDTEMNYKEKIDSNKDTNYLFSKIEKKISSFSNDISNITSTYSNNKVAEAEKKYSYYSTYGSKLSKNIDINANTDTDKIGGEIKKTMNVEEEISIASKKPGKYDKLVQELQLLIENILTKHFDEENIKKAMIAMNLKSHPKLIIQELIEIGERLVNSVSNDSDFQKLIKIFKEGITFFEIEKSSIMLNLATFFDKNYLVNYSKIVNDDNFPIECCGSYDENVIKKCKEFYKFFNNDSLSLLLEIIQNSITSMNCFKILLYDTLNSKIAISTGLKKKNQKFKIKFSYNSVDSNKVDMINMPISKNSKKLYEMAINKFTTLKTFAIVVEQNNFFYEIEPKIFDHLEESDFLIDFKDENKTEFNYFNNIEDEEMSYYKKFSNVSNNDANKNSLLNSEKEKINSDIKDKNYKSNYSGKKSKENINTKNSNLEDMISDLITSRKDFEGEDNLTDKLLKHLKDLRDLRKESNISNESDCLKIDTINELEKTNYITQDYLDAKEELLSNLVFTFYLDTGSRNISILKNWNINDFTREIKNKLTKNEFSEFSGKDITINFTIQPKNTDKKESLIKLFSRKQSEMYNPNSIIETKTEYCIVTYFEKIFLHKYNGLVLNNPDLYLIKRVSPFVFILTLVNLCKNSFEFIFNLENSQNLMENKKITSLIQKQCKDIYSISTSSTPIWCKNFCESMPFICAFNSRYLLFKTTSFETNKSLYNLFLYMRNFLGEKIDETSMSNLIGKKNRVTVQRSKIIDSALSLMNSKFCSIEGFLDFEFKEEVGTGLGPTQEFFSLFYTELKTIKDLWFNTTDSSLFPIPLGINATNKESKCDTFKLLGYIIARAIYDDRLIDFPLSTTFWDIVLDRQVSISNLFKLEKNIFGFYNDLVQKIYANDTRSDAILYLESLGITFIIPGYKDVELKEKGDEITLDCNNYNEYLVLMLDRMVGSGIKPLAKAFKAGFNKVFPIENMKVFSSREIEEILLTSFEETWTEELLDSYINTNHGIAKSSNIYKYFVKYMISLDNKKRRDFLTFVTGCPRLPLGGIKNLTPKITIVKKLQEKSIEAESNQDNYLPSVMTCYNFIKIPEYSTYDILAKNFDKAITDGNFAFNLS
jgi:hypothetical protein